MSTLALPTNKDENWRYANLRPLAKANSAAIAAGTFATAIALPAPVPGFERWVFVDGRHQAALSDPSAGTVASVLKFTDAGETFASLLDSDLATAGVDFALARTNARHGDQVLHCQVDGAANEARIEVLFISTQAAVAGTSYPRVQLHAGRNGKVSLIERHLSAGPTDSAVNAAVDIAVGAGAVVSHVRVQNCADAASCFDTLVVHVGDAGTYRLRTVTLGALTSRSTLFIKLAGRASRCELSAASVANGIQTHDLFAEIEHVGQDSVTREVFRGIATERGKLAFNGKMIVREHAHGADSDQSLKSLLNGSGAEASARPQLEIYTDKVRAKHGATTGKLDDQMLFYLLSRGIDRPTAQALLQWAFIEDAVSQVEPLELRRDVESLIAAQLLEVSALRGLLGDAA
jgi:Fe-S cluster assembly protein SufD